VLEEGGLRRYPRPEYEPLRELVARQEGLPGKEWVYFGNGSDEILAFCFTAFFNHEKPVRFADITYSFYPVLCNLNNLPYEIIPLSQDFALHAKDYAPLGGGIVIANPNAPTALALAEEEVKAIIESHPDEVVLVDEAYMIFGGQSAARWVKEYPNLIVVRTMSKSHSMAGMRVGYCIGQPHLVEGVIRVKNCFNSYTMDTIAQTTAFESLNDEAYTREVVNKVIHTRQWFSKALKDLGFVGPESQANFVFTSHPAFSGTDLFMMLKKKGILVRHFSKPERIEPFLRITIGTDEEMEKVIETMKEIIKDK
jgi:histidinol-phosphate aminotransferase